MARPAGRQEARYAIIDECSSDRPGVFSVDSPERGPRTPPRKARTSDAASPKRHSAPGVGSFIDTAADSEDGLSPRPSEEQTAIQPLRGAIKIVTRPPIETRRESDVSVTPSSAVSHAPSSVTSLGETDPSSPATQTDTMSFTQPRSRSELDLYFGRDEIIDKFLFASVTANGAMRTVTALMRQTSRSWPCS